MESSSLLAALKLDRPGMFKVEISWCSVDRLNEHLRNAFERLLCTHLQGVRNSRV